MKIHNIVLREILLFLEFQDIKQSKLHLVNKQFYHNIIENPELIRRMIPHLLTLTMDYTSELSYQTSILQKSTSTPSAPTSPLKFLKFYEGTCLPSESENFSSQGFSVGRVIEIMTGQVADVKEGKGELLCCVCKRTTGGQDEGIRNVKCIFENEKYCFKEAYNSGEQLYFPNGICCATAIPLYEDNKASGSDKDGHDDIKEDFDDDEENRRLEDYKYEKFNLNHIYDNYTFVGHPKTLAQNPHFYDNCEDSKIIEIDTSYYDDLIIQNLFCINEVKISSFFDSSCPVKAIAFLVHDIPINCEDHPLSLLIQKVYDLSGWKNQDVKVRENLSESEEDLNVYHSEEEGEEKDQDSEFRDFIQLFDNISKARLIPKLSNKSKKWIEFDQKFYSKKFDPKHINEEQKFNLEELGIDHKDIEKITELYDEMKDQMDYYRLRLAAIAYDLDVSLINMLMTKDEEYIFKFNQMITGRFATIIALDAAVNSKPDPNIDIGNIGFYGKVIPSVLKVEK
ncbi:unnamed protein product [Moneuplotes crassus]|uniref:F-box domain-containing protein n=1 Tax=Euplotes crassus TaxID=5936 RepID=A0AAD1Y8N8_EUPCR|nr:unnamed protein product [Moneuplotes crassus]